MAASCETFSEYPQDEIQALSAIVVREKDYALQNYTANGSRDAAIDVCSYCTKVNDLLSTEVFTPDPALSLMNRIASEPSGKYINLR